MEQEAGKRKSVTVKTLKKALKKAGLKTSGKKATLTRRAKKAHLMGGALGDACITLQGEEGTENENGVCVPTPPSPPPQAGGRHRGRRHA